ncbi:Pantoate-beta-alanine ligase [Lipomyces kononenkoae]|uniref:Pantoate-beta-alanine ligase n=1 Tax=Lipomyces kononenkoae TaxID=34357 RepID=A0ACC3T796_LIPKO
MAIIVPRSSWPLASSALRLFNLLPAYNRPPLLCTLRHNSTAAAAAAEIPEPRQSPIQILRTLAEVRSWRRDQLIKGLTVGFVPTMGALHAGHMRLVQSSLRMNDATIVSIFVNPSQFAPTEDLASYPRDFEADVEQLAAQIGDDRQVDVVFAPTVEEIYPNGIPLDIDQQKGAFVTVHGLSEQLEGKIRPQFFRGVATVVSKLLNIVSPDRVYFGQKDVQQTVVVKRLVQDLCYGSVVHVVATGRDANGLALSSRNAYLTDQTRQDAAVIYKGLQNALMVYRQNTSAEKIIEAVVSSITEKFGKEDIEYVCVNDKDTLEELEIVQPLKGAIVSVAVRVPNKFGGKTRLIDNILL